MSSPPAPGPVMQSQILFCQSEDGTSRIEIRLDEGTVWLTLALIAELYQTTTQNVSLPIRNILAEGELSQAATVKEYLTVQIEGSRRAPSSNNRQPVTLQKKRRNSSQIPK